MNNNNEEKWVTFDNLDKIIAGVNAKGIVSHEEKLDDYQKLLAKKEFSQLVSYEIYEAYFYADRHEFDLLLIEELVKAVVEFFTSPEVIHANSTLLRHLLQEIPTIIVVLICEHIKEECYVNRSRNEKYNKICQNAKKIQKYFEKNLYIETRDIEIKLEESPDKIIPLLKLLGCKHYVYDKQDFWLAPVGGKKDESERDK